MDRRVGRNAASLCLLGCAALVALGQNNPFPANSTALPDHPFFIKKTWIVGGHGNWDYLTMDAKANQLYITHGSEVQVVDVETGDLAGNVVGLRQAHAVALEEDGEYGYVSDGPADQIDVFNRRTFEVVAHIPTAPAPRSIALDRSTGLLVAVCAGSNAAPQEARPAANGSNRRQPQQHPSASPPAEPAKPKSELSIIDTQTRTELARIVVSGHLGFVQGDGQGVVYLTVEDRNQIDQLDLAALASRLRQTSAGQPTAATTAASTQPSAQAPAHLDWGDDHNTSMRVLYLGQDCRGPRAFAIDSKDRRLFAACANLKLAALNTSSGETLASVPIGPAPDAVGYDPDRDLIFTSNGGADGSLTIIRRTQNDTYNVIQTLPTRQQARTLAVDPSTGQVFLVTVIQVAKAGSPPLQGIGTLTTIPEDRSFQVLVVGN